MREREIVSDSEEEKARLRARERVCNQNDANVRHFSRAAHWRRPIHIHTDLFIYLYMDFLLLMYLYRHLYYHTLAVLSSQSNGSASPEIDH